MIHRNERTVPQFFKKKKARLDPIPIHPFRPTLCRQNIKVKVAAKVSRRNPRLTHL